MCVKGHMKLFLISLELWKAQNGSHKKKDMIVINPESDPHWNHTSSGRDNKQFYQSE